MTLQLRKNSNKNNHKVVHIILGVDGEFALQPLKRLPESSFPYRCKNPCCNGN